MWMLERMRFIDFDDGNQNVLDVNKDDSILFEIYLHTKHIFLPSVKISNLSEDGWLW